MIVEHFSLNRPFTIDDSFWARGAIVDVKCFDSGLEKTYTGEMQPVDHTKTSVGEEVLLNECIRKVTYVNS